MNTIPNPYETLFRKLEEMHEELTALRAQVAAINSTLPEWCSYTQAAAINSCINGRKVVYL